MSNFKYIAIDEKGQRQEGTIEAFSREDAGWSLRRMGVNVIDVFPIKSRRKKIKLSELNLSPPRIDPSLRVIFFRQLATLLNAGIQLADGLEILQLQFRDKHFSRVIRDVSEFVRSGQPFSEALKAHPRIFPVLVVSLVKAAEMGGGMDRILDQIATYVEREDAIRGKLRSATSYPKFIMGFFALVLVGVIFGLLPKFREIFQSFDAELPAPTLVILAISDFVRGHLMAELSFIALFVVSFKLFKKSGRGKRYLDQHILSVPIAGSLIHKTIITRMAQTLSVLLKSGVSLIDALRIAGETSNNLYVNQVVDKIVEQIARGKSLASQLSLYPRLFPVMASSMVAVGERSGALPLMLEKIAQFTDQDFNTRVDRLSKTIEPVIMGGLGIVICIVVLALYLPIFQMTGAIH